MVLAALPAIQMLRIKLPDALPVLGTVDSFALVDEEDPAHDARAGVDPQLRPTRSVLCFACQMPLKEEEQKDPRYVYEVSCPHCFNRPQSEPQGKGRSSTEDTEKGRN